jgi:hypothetical protein
MYVYVTLLTQWLKNLKLFYQHYKQKREHLNCKEKVKLSLCFN